MDKTADRMLTPPEKFNILSQVIYPESDLGIYSECTDMVGHKLSQDRESAHILISILYMHTGDKLIRLSEYSYPYIN